MVGSDSNVYLNESGAQNCVGLNEVNIMKKKLALVQKGWVQYVPVTSY
jgi:hypothetical protein